MQDTEHKLRLQQNVYDVARDERTSYSKSLLQVEDEITVISREFRSMTRMVLTRII